MHTSSKKVAAGAAIVATAALAGTSLVTTANASPGVATHAIGSARDHGHPVRAHLDPLNNSGVTGHASVRSHGSRIHVRVKARHLAAGLPHAQHIHYGAQARHECPTVADDTNGDVRLTTAEGVPAYGPVQVSLTTSGDTSPSSALAVDRFPTAAHGRVDYVRTTHTSASVAEAIRRGEAVVVIHGVDYNHNGRYDFDSAGKSDLDPALPAEATDPAACGVLRHRH